MSSLRVAATRSRLTTNILDNVGVDGNPKRAKTQGHEVNFIATPASAVKREQREDTPGGDSNQTRVALSQPFD